MAIRDSISKYTMIMMAAEEGEVNKVRSLLPNNHINDKNQCGHTALSLAVKNGHVQIVRDLITNGADLNSTNNAGQSVLFIACWNGKEECVNLLLQNDANVNVADQRGWTPLIISVYHNFCQIVQILLDHGASMEHKDCFGKKAIDRAKSVEMISILNHTTKPDSSVRPPLDRRFNQSQVSSGSRKARSVSREKTVTLPRSRSIDSGKKAQSVSQGTPPRQRGRNLTPKTFALSEVDQRRKFRDEMDRYIRASTTTLGCQVAEKSYIKIQSTLSSELRKAEEMLKSELDVMLTKQAKEQFQRMKEYSFRLVEGQMMEQGYKIPKTDLVRAEFNAEIPPRRRTLNSRDLAPEAPQRMYEALLKVPSEREVVLSRNVNPNADGEEIKAELTEYINRHIQDLSSRLEKLTNDNIKNLVKHKVEKLRQVLVYELHEVSQEMNVQLMGKTEWIVSERFKEIQAFNSQPQSQTRSSPAKAYDSEFTRDRLAIPSRSHDLETSQTSKYDFISSLPQHNADKLQEIQQMAPQREMQSMAPQREMQSMAPQREIQPMTPQRERDSSYERTQLPERHFREDSHIASQFYGEPPQHEVRFDVGNWTDPGAVSYTDPNSMTDYSKDETPASTPKSQQSNPADVIDKLTKSYKGLSTSQHNSSASSHENMAKSYNASSSKQTTQPRKRSNSGQKRLQKTPPNTKVSESLKRFLSSEEKLKPDFEYYTKSFK